MSIDLTLNRIRALLSHLPLYTRPTCHIAGTNGKGSVSALVASILSSSSPPLSVGRFNSPHLVSIYDSIVINNQPVKPSVYAHARDLVEKANRDHDVGASSFELLTSTALLVFETFPVDVVVMEVGMGGRLDATNVIPDECILVSALTAVDLDHQAFLGDTVELIAREKAAIARRGRPFVLGPQKYPEVEAAAGEIVSGAGGDLFKAAVAYRRPWNEATDGPSPPQMLFSRSSLQRPAGTPVKVHMQCFQEPVDALLPLQGEHQLSNLGVASSIVSQLLTHPSCQGEGRPNFKQCITPTSIARGIQLASWPGRLSFHTLSLPRTESDGRRVHRDLTVLVDGAHNPSSSATLSAYISQLLSPTAGTLQEQPPLSKPPLVREITISYILALSHSPPKTPMQTLSPLLPPRHAENVKVQVNVAVVRFTPPEGMPWVKSVPPSELRRTVSALFPAADVWCSPDEEDPRHGQLKETLDWVVSKQEAADGEHLVVLAGSLYLVADFYRLMKAISR